MITDRLRAISNEFGAALGTSVAVESYRRKQEALERVPEVHHLDETLQHTYDQLTARQRAGETLGKEEVDGFYALRAQVQQERLIIERDQALTEVKGHFLNAALILSDKLGLDYSVLAHRA